MVEHRSPFSSDSRRVLPNGCCSFVGERWEYISVSLIVPSTRIFFRCSTKLSDESPGRIALQMRCSLAGAVPVIGQIRRPSSSPFEIRRCRSMKTNYSLAYLLNKCLMCHCRGNPLLTDAHNSNARGWGEACLASGLPMEIAAPYASFYLPWPQWVWNKVLVLFKILHRDTRLATDSR